jgi:hypothetical protein
MLTCGALLLTMLDMSSRIRICLASCMLSACFLGNLGADKKIDSAVHNLNEQARWGRISDAAALVQPEYREVFLDRHRNWGSEIQLADTEVINIQVATDSHNANATVNYSWYAIADMTLHETTLRQVWSAHNSNYALASELVVRGDPALLSGPEAKATTQ